MKIASGVKDAMELGKAQDLKLLRTKTCVQMFRDAQGKWPTELVDELWKLAETMAIVEWGEGTVLDDFAVEDRILAKNKTRELLL